MDYEYIKALTTQTFTAILLGKRLSSKLVKSRTYKFLQTTVASLTAIFHLQKLKKVLKSLQFFTIKKLFN